MASRLIKAHADDVGLAGSLDGIADAGGGTLVGTKDADHALGDEVLSAGLALSSIALAVLGFQDVEIGTLKGGAEAFLTLDARVGSGVDVDDADVARRSRQRRSEP